MSESKRRATRNKAYGLGHASGKAGRERLNPYKQGSTSKAFDSYERGYLDGKQGYPRVFERDPVLV